MFMIFMQNGKRSILGIGVFYFDPGWPEWTNALSPTAKRRDKAPVMIILSNNPMMRGTMGNVKTEGMVCNRGVAGIRI
jgi:alpha/beta superfamily hydrolase